MTISACTPITCNQEGVFHKAFSAGKSNQLNTQRLSLSHGRNLNSLVRILPVPPSLMHACYSGTHERENFSGLLVYLKILRLRAGMG